MSQEKKELSKRDEQAHRKASKKKLNVIYWVSFLALVIGGIVWMASASSSNVAPTDDNYVLARRGIHWHSHLDIIIKGKAVPISPGIGLTGAVHNPIHVHDPDGIIHLEFEGRVTNKDTELKKFFDVWGKDFSKDSLLGNKTGKDGKVLMSVNGKENYDFEKYHMKDGDKIVLKFE